MSDTVERAVDALKRMRPADQESMAQAILSVARGDLPLDIEAEHLSHVLEGLAQIERGEFATDGDVRAAFRSFEP